MATSALVVLSAALYALAFPPVGAFPLAWLALAPLFAALVRVGPARGAALGLVWGVLAGAGVVSWLPRTVAEFFGTSPAAGAALSLAALVAFAGVYYAAFGAWLAWLARRGAAHPLVVAIGWGACEWLRASAWIENPWALVAYSQAPWLPFVQGADLAGPFGLGVLIAAANATLVGVVGQALRPRRAALAAAAAAALLAADLGYGAWRLRQGFGAGEPVAVALVQGAVEPERRFAPAWREANLERHLALTARAAQADLVVWPEFAVDFYLEQDGALRRRLLAAAGADGPELLVGAPEHRYRMLVREETNSALLLRAGRLADRYDKIALMPFSERNPLPRFFGLGRDRYGPGLELRPLRSAAGALGVLLCSESMHPAHVRALARRGAVILANPSNDDWYASRGAARQQLGAVAFRAIENRRWLVRPSTSGISSAIDPHGRVVASARYGEPEVVLASVRASDATPPYQRWGDRPLAAASGLALLWTLVAARGRRPHA